MGCFSKTCSATNQAIHEGDEVVFFHSKNQRQTYDLMSTVSMSVSLDKSYKDFKDSLKDLDDLAVKVREIVDQEDVPLMDSVIKIEDSKVSTLLKVTGLFIGVGEYDDYGGIKGYKTKDNIAMVHKLVYDEIVEEGKENSENILSLLGLMMSARKPLIYTTLLGHQHFDEYEDKAQKQLFNITGILFKQKSSALEEE